MPPEDEPSPVSSSASPSSRGAGDKDTPERSTSTSNSNTAATTASGAGAAARPGQQPPPRKRRRIIISCTECHRRKQKCDRQLPCTNCVSRNKQDSCRYEAAAPTAKRAREYGPPVAGGEPGAGAGADAGGGSGEVPQPQPQQQQPQQQQQQQQQQQRAPRPSKYDIDPRLRFSSVPPPPVDGGSGGSSVVAGESPTTTTRAKPLHGDTNFGYAGTGAGTLGFLKRIDDAQMPGESLSSLAMGRENMAYFGTRERYKSLIRQLPARPYIEKLVDVYFKDFNWQYNGVDQYVFDRQIDEWYSLPFNVLNTEGPQAFAPDMRAFPALVFQLIATGLLILGTGPDPTFDSLKYNASMTFEDLATDYSESGVALLNLLGKRQVSHTAVIAGWIRSAFLKYSGFITESWHALGSAVRDAQECGLHRDSLDPRPKSDRLEDILENQWEIQRRRKTWCILRVWDVHTGVVLGRPVSVDHSVSYTLPIDAPTPKDPSRTPITQRSENDPPSLMTRTLYIHKIAEVLKDIVDLEKEGPCPKDFTKVDRLHEQLVTLDAETPAFFRRENPDTRYDDLPECFWVPLVREQLYPLVWFNFMALHRAYVFTRPHSRREALKASLRMLDCQRDNFANLSPRHYKTFQLFFGTFDAVVLMASIYILFPKENPEFVSAALQHFQWAVERFETMAERNRLAASARGVLHAIHTRLKKALGASGLSSVPAAGSPALGSLSLPAKKETALSTISAGSNTDNAQNMASPPLTVSGSSGTRDTSIFTTPDSASDPYYGPPRLSMSEHTPCDPGLAGVAASDWTLPEGFNWSSIQPVYAMADVAYNDLMGISSSEADLSTTNPSMPNWAGGAPLLNNVSPVHPAAGTGGGASEGWSFGGDFGNDSVWSILNHFGQF